MSRNERPVMSPSYHASATQTVRGAEKEVGDAVVKQITTVIFANTISEAHSAALFWASDNNADINTVVVKERG